MAKPFPTHVAPVVSAAQDLDKLAMAIKQAKSNRLRAERILERARAHAEGANDRVSDLTEQHRAKRAFLNASSYLKD
jgi:hypothetical protein